MIIDTCSLLTQSPSCWWRKWKRSSRRKWKRSSRVSSEAAAFHLVLCQRCAQSGPIQDILLSAPFMPLAFWHLLRPLAANSSNWVFSHLRSTRLLLRKQLQIVSWWANQKQSSWLACCRYVWSRSCAVWRLIPGSENWNEMKLVMRRGSWENAS